MDVEEDLLRAFIAPERRSRCVALLATPKTRKKLLGSFYHLRDLDRRFARRVDPNLFSADFVYEELRQRGAPERCYVMSASSQVDGEEADLRAALEEIVGVTSRARRKTSDTSSKGPLRTRGAVPHSGISAERLPLRPNSPA